MTYGLKEKDIAAKKMYLPGLSKLSRLLFTAQGQSNYKSASDIDIVFKGKYLNTTVINKIANRLDDLLLPYTFDLSMHQHIKNPDLLAHIERVGKIFYEQKIPIS